MPAACAVFVTRPCNSRVRHGRSGRSLDKKLNDSIRNDTSCTRVGAMEALLVALSAWWRSGGGFRQSESQGFPECPRYSLAGASGHSVHPRIRPCPQRGLDSDIGPPEQIGLSEYLTAPIPIEWRSSASSSDPPIPPGATVIAGKTTRRMERFMLLRFQSLSVVSSLVTSHPVVRNPCRSRY